MHLNLYIQHLETSVLFICNTVFSAQHATRTPAGNVWEKDPYPDKPVQSSEKGLNIKVERFLPF